MRKFFIALALILNAGTVFAKMPEAECHKLLSEVYKYAETANSENKEDIKKLYELSTKLTEECEYLMNEEVLKQRREYNYILHKKLNKKTQ